MSHLNGQIVRLYDTVFDRAPDAEGLEFWNNATHHGGLGLRDLATFFIAGPEFAATYGEPTVQGLVESLYQFFTEFVRPAGDETCGRLAGSVGGEVGFVMVRTSPHISWIRDA